VDQMREVSAAPLKKPSSCCDHSASQCQIISESSTYALDTKYLVLSMVRTTIDHSAVSQLTCRFLPQWTVPSISWGRKLVLHHVSHMNLRF
jgi:hypothetical protein